MTLISATNKQTPLSLRGCRLEQGFTLLELMVVSFLIVLVIGITIPNITSTDNTAFVAQVRRAVATLTYARRLAVVEAEPQTAIFFNWTLTAPNTTRSNKRYRPIPWKPDG